MVTTPEKSPNGKGEEMPRATKTKTAAHRAAVRGRSLRLRREIIRGNQSVLRRIATKDLTFQGLTLTKLGRWKGCR